MADPRVSVIVPFYAVEDYFRDCLESLKRQTLDSIEFVLVDDGSWDRSYDIAVEYAKEDPRFRIVRQDNRGLGPARNAGVEASRGEFIAFVDSDDVVAPRAYEMMLASLEETGSDFVSGNVHRFTRPGWTQQSWAHREAMTIPRQRAHITDVPVLVGDRMAWNKLIRREFWEAHGFAFPPIRYEDYPVTMRMHLEATAVDVISDPVYFWRIRGSGTSITQQAKELGNMRDRIASNTMVLDLFKDRSLPAVERKLHNHFLDVDIVALAKGFGEIDQGSDHEIAIELHALAQRIEPRLSKGFVRADAAHRAMRAGNWSQLRGLFSDDPVAAMRSLDARDARSALRKVGGKAKARVEKVVGERDRKLRFRFVDVLVHDGGLTLTVCPQINRAVLTRAEPHAALVGANGAELPLTVQQRIIDDQVLYDIEVSHRVRELDTNPLGQVFVEFGFELGPFRWRGQGEFDPTMHPGLLHVPGIGAVQLVSAYVQRQFAPCLRLVRIGDSYIEITGEFDGDHLRLRTTSDDEAVFSFATGSGAVLEFSTVDGVAQLPLTEIGQIDPVDNPVVGSAHRGIWCTVSGQPRLRATLAQQPSEHVVGAQQWSLEINQRGQAELVRRPSYDRKMTKPTDPVYLL